MHWQDNTPDIRTVQAVVIHLQAVGFKTGVIFDANAGYLLTDKYRNERYFARKLKLKTNQVMVVPKGTPADAYLLQASREMNARIVTNDRFRDWADAYPEIAEPDRLIRGGFRNGNLWFDL